MLKKLLCWLGGHSWTYKQLSRGNALLTTNDNLDLFRACTRCNKKQVREVHCLGLNPPNYAKYWVTTKRSY